jgi:hypothetical protein
MFSVVASNFGASQYLQLLTNECVICSSQTSLWSVTALVYISVCDDGLSGMVVKPKAEFRLGLCCIAALHCAEKCLIQSCFFLQDLLAHKTSGSSIK